MILEPWKAIKLEPWKFGYMSLVVVWIDSNRPQEKVIVLECRKRNQVCKTCLELASLVLVDQDFHFQYQVVSMSFGAEQLQQCAMINKILNYIRQRPQLKKHEPHHYLQLPTQCQVCLESTNAMSSCDEQPAVMRILVSTQHLHPLDHLPQVSACQVRFKPKGNHSRTPCTDWWPAISELSRLAILWHLFYILHPSAHSLDTNTFGSTKPFKEGRGSIIIFPRSMCVKSFWSSKATILEPQVLTDGQL